MKKLLVASLFFLSTASIAQGLLPPQPLTCPDVSAIQNVGVSHTTLQIDNRWFAGRRHQAYGTTDLWTFLLGNIVAMTSVDAYNKAVQALPTLTFRMGPFTSSDHWVCLYNTDVHNLPAVAITLPIAFSDAPLYFN